MNKWRANAPMSLLVLGLGAFIVAAPASAATYSFTELAPLSGGEYGTPVAINNLGQVVGTTGFRPVCWGCGGTTVATFWNGGVPTQVPFPTGGHSYATDINDAGQIVGWTSEKTTTYYGAFMWDSSASGPSTSLGTTSYYHTAHGINSAGQVAGTGIAQGSGSQAVVWDSPLAWKYVGGLGGSATDLNDAGQVLVQQGVDVVVWSAGSTSVLSHLNGQSSYAMAINNAGQVAGTSGGHAVVWEGTTPMDLGTLSGVSSAAGGINEHGDVVGVYNDGGYRAFLWNGTEMTDLTSFLDASTTNAGWMLYDATDINDKGQIVGLAYNTISGLYSGYILTPVPEPAAFAMMLSGLALVGFKTCRRRGGSV